MKGIIDSPEMSTSEGADTRKVEAFLQHEAHLLDERRFEEWMELFTDDGYYWAPARADQQSPYEEVSLFFDDRDAMRIRVKRLRHPQIHAQSPPSVMARLVANVFIEDVESDNGAIRVRSKFMICEWRPSVPEGEHRVLGGTYKHQLVERGGELKIAWKKATLVNCDARHSPLYVYF